MESQEVKIDKIWFENGSDIEHQFYGPMDMKWFLDKMYGNALSGHLLLRSIDNQDLYLFDTEGWLPAVLKAIELAKTTDILFCIGLFSSDLLDGGYRDPDDITIVPGLWMNIDIKCSMNSGRVLPTSNEAFRFLKSQSMKPDFIVDAVSELQGYWLFKEPFYIDSVDDRNEIKNLSRDFQHKIIIDGQRYGWEIQDTSSLINLQRLPGTFNHAFNPPKPVKLMEYAHI